MSAPALSSLDAPETQMRDPEALPQGSCETLSARAFTPAAIKRRYEEDDEDMGDEDADLDFDDEDDLDFDEESDDFDEDEDDFDEDDDFDLDFDEDEDDFDEEDEFEDQLRTSYLGS